MRPAPRNPPPPAPRQPWLGQGAMRSDDDFSAASATMPLRQAMAALALAFLILAMVRAPHITAAAYDLPILPGTEALIAAAEAWEAAMGWIGLAALVRSLT